MSKKIFVWLGLVIVLFGSFRLANQRALSFHFVDEEDHIVTADFMNQGLKLYKDLSVNHQPLVYLGSQVLQKITKPNSLYLLIKTHRLAMFAYGALWSVMLVGRFGLVGLVFSLFFEGLKLYGFGNLWLMESLAVYPAVYIFGRMIQSLLTKKWPGKWESSWLGVCSFLVMFNLVPLWPWLAIVWLVFLIKNKQRFWRQLIGLVIPTAILFILISPIDWFRETIYYNVVYAMPRLSVVNTVGDWLKIICFPFLAFITKNSYQAIIVCWLTVGWVIGSVWKRKYSLLLLSYFLLVLANLRVLSPGSVFYAGFHLLPWMGLLLISCLLIVKELKNKLLVVGLCLWGLVLILNRNMPYWWQTDSMNEHYINYSHFDDINFAVKTMAKPGDRLAVLTSESLIYWQTGTMPATRQVVYYAWEHDVPLLQKTYEQVFKGENPPEFIYGSNEAELVKAKYTPLFKNSKPTELYVKNSVAEFLPEAVEKSLNNRNINIL